MKKVAMPLLLLFVLASIHSQDYVAVVPFGVDESLVSDEEAIREMLKVELNKAGLTIVTRDFAGILTEAGFQRSSGMVNESTITKIGYATGANFVAHGTIKYIWESYNISCSIISVETGILYCSGNVGIETLDYNSVQLAIKDLVFQMLGDVNVTTLVLRENQEELSLTIADNQEVPQPIEMPEDFVFIEGDHSSFWISKYEYPGTGIPRSNVSWYEACIIANEKSIEQGLEPAYYSDRQFTTVYREGRRIFWKNDANGYRLPTNREWRYAARGGNQSSGYKFSGGNNVSEVAWYAGNSGRVVHPVGEKLPNEMGLFDMTGNLAEWTWEKLFLGADFKTYPLEECEISFTIPAAWDDTSRRSGHNFIGFRLVRSE